MIKHDRRWPSRRFSLRRLPWPPAFQYAQFRLYWAGMLASVGGFQIFIFAQVVISYQLTHSPLFLGYVGLANAVPAILLNLFGGVLADRMDRRRLLILTQTIIAALLAALATLVLLDVLEPWHLLAVAFVAGTINAFDQPARQALFPSLIDRSVMMSAVALNSVVWQGTRVVAPYVGGIIIAQLNPASSFYVAGGGVLGMVLVLVRLRVPNIPTRNKKSAVSDLMEGLAFIRGNAIFLFLIGMTFFNSFFAMSYVWLIPIFAEEHLTVGPEGQGALLGMTGLGGLLVTLTLSGLGKFPRPRLFIVGGAVVSGLSTAVFALTADLVGSFPLAMALMFIMGASSNAYMVAIRSCLQVLVPDQMRGRVMGFHGMMWSIMPLGGMQAGIAASFIGAPWAIAIGGFAVAAFAIGPAMLSTRVRALGVEMRLAEITAPSPSGGEDGAQS